MSIFKRLIKSAAITLVALYFCALAALYFLQDSLVFPAPGDPIVELSAPAQYSEMTTSDGETLRHVRFKADDGAPKLMFFHGNGSLAAYEINRGRKLFENGFDVLLVEYRGYGGSSGQPSAEALRRDALETYDWYKGDSSDWIFAYAHSLGTGIAAHLASKREVQSLVLEAPYASLSEIAADRYPMFPVKALFKHEIDSIASLSQSGVPTLVIHGEEDRVIPVRYGAKLYKSLDQNAADWNSLPGVGHNNLVQNGSVNLALNHFIKSF